MKNKEIVRIVLSRRKAAALGLHFPADIRPDIRIRVPSALTIEKQVEMLLIFQAVVNLFEEKIVHLLPKKELKELFKCRASCCTKGIASWYVTGGMSPELEKAWSKKNRMLHYLFPTKPETVTHK